MKQEIGTLLHLYLDEIQAGEPIEAHDFLISGAVKAIHESGGRNWIPLIVKQLGLDEYQAIANGFILVAAQEAGLEKVWCIIADDSDATEKSARILAQETTFKINLATATREEIKTALDYLRSRPVNPLVGVKIPVATDKIESAPRKYWKEDLTDVPKLKCGITKGKKLDIFREVFYTIPEPLPDVITDRNWLSKLTVPKLKKMAKKRGKSGYSRFNKGQLVELLAGD